MNFRSPHLLDRNTSALLVVDIQEKLIPSIECSDQVIANANKLIEAASILRVPILVSEQYPRGLGHTAKGLNISAADIVEEKAMFSCRECAKIVGFLQSKDIQTVLICGIEAHVCVAQTAFDFQAMGFGVHIPVDAVGSRGGSDKDTAISRMTMHGIVTTTTEASIFEWCETSAADEFKQISNLIK